MMKSIEATAATLYQIRREIDALNRKAQMLRQRIIEEVGNHAHIIVGNFAITTEEVTTVQYLKVLQEIQKRHPEIAEEVRELMSQFKTVTVRVNIDKLS